MINSTQGEGGVNLHRRKAAHHQGHRKSAVDKEGSEKKGRGRGREGWVGVRELERNGKGSTRIWGQTLSEIRPKTTGTV